MKSLSAWFSELSARERRLISVFGLLFGVALLFLVPFGVDAMLKSRREANAALREALHHLQAGKSLVRARQARRDQIAARYAKKAPKLGGFLEQLGKDNNIEIQDVQDKPDLPIGKRYTERSTVVHMRRVAGYPMLKFLEKIEQSGYPVAVTRMNIRKRGGDHDSYDLELVISAYDRGEAPAAAPAPASSAEGK